LHDGSRRQRLGGRNDVHRQQNGAVGS
jgi:hypothetical protein